MPRPTANPANRFLDTDLIYEPGLELPADLEVREDQSESILSKNDSPDLGFRFSLNPYRGCFHGCVYCYARPTHEYLSLGTGTDFERKLFVKPRAARLLRQTFERRSWKGEVILFSGATDCYQPLEAEHRLTRECLEVCAEYRNPVSIVTKAPLIERDLDVLCRLHERTSLHITLTVPFLDPEAAHALEPFVALPERRLRTIRRLAEAGLDVGINVAPFVPGLSERDLAGLLEEARAAGAVRAAFILLRLPGSVREVFTAGLNARLPLVAEHVLSRVKDVRGGALNDPRFGRRMQGEGAYAETVAALFGRLVHRLGFNELQRARPLEPASFRRPTDAGGQLRLFAEP